MIYSDNAYSLLNQNLVCPADQASKSKLSQCLHAIASKSISENIDVLNRQIQQIVNNSSNNRKLLTNTVSDSLQQHQRQIQRGQTIDSGHDTSPQIYDGQITLPNK